MKRGERDAPVAGTRTGTDMGFLKVFLAVMGLALTGAMAGTAIFFWTRNAPTGVDDTIAVSIGATGFRLPIAYVRAGALPRPGAQDRVDLVLAFPGLDAAGTSPTPGASRIFLALMREDGVVDPAERVNDIYGRFLEPDIWQNPGGLLLRRFAPDSPYADEELFISPPDGRAFHARCRKPATRADSARTSEIGEACLWRFRLGGVDALVRFAPDILPQWESLAEGMQQKIRGWRTD